MATQNPKVYQGGSELVTRPVAGSSGVAVRIPPGSILASWTLNAGDVGQGILTSGYITRTLTNHSTSYGSSTFGWQGSNDSTDGVNGTWFAIHDMQGNAISAKVTDAIYAVQDVPLWIAPIYSAGSGAALTAQLVGESERI